jgi:polysaccharide biosynthesis protein PelA
VAPKILRKGFDGLFLDNTDMVEGHRRQAKGMRVLVRNLARLTHGRKKLLFTQNGDRSIGPTLRYYDGWNREDVTWTYDFRRRAYRRVRASSTAAAQATMRRLAARGLLVTSSDYTRKGDNAAAAQAIANSCAAGGLPFVTNILLTRIPRVAPACP